ncbi:MAG TPA: amino acid permease [Pirellulaceae bacterium]|jgi:APA family basic amino acid/polyamine antiporter|nr:amino acid permease [Pirellulaceae bacterium]
MTTGTLRRETGLLGATALGLGSVIGTGVFVSVAVAAEAAGPAVLLAIVVAAAVAACNGLSSAQLAANHPVSGGTYEYGYRWLTPSLGFVAGWTFLVAKSASAATAALGFAGYVLRSVGGDAPTWLLPIALSAVACITALVLCGLRRSIWANSVIVALALAALAAFVVTGLPAALSNADAHLVPFFAPAEEGLSPIEGFFRASALAFVAFAGYGRVATMAEEVHDPRATIPRAIIATLVISAAVYSAVAVVGVAAVGSEAFGAAANEGAAPLEIAAASFGIPGVGSFIAVGAVAAMLGSLLNLILGLSRVVFAMGRRGDAPGFFTRIDDRGSTPYAAVLLVGAVTTGLTLIGDVGWTWSFSAFSVLIYYAVTNLAALRLTPEERLYPRWIAGAGLGACLFLAFWVEARIWLVGLSVIGIGLLWHLVCRRLRRKSELPDATAD